MFRRPAHRKPGVATWRSRRTAFAVLLLTVTLAGCAASDPTAGPEASATSSHKATSELSAGRKNAVRSAKSYLDLSGFSRAGLIRQLTSKAGDGYSKADATYAVDHAGADWNAEAVESAKAYLDMSGFSRKSLINQLTSPAGDQYTKAQARHAADEVGL